MRALDALFFRKRPLASRRRAVAGLRRLRRARVRRALAGLRLLALRRRLILGAFRRRTRFLAMCFSPFGLVVADFRAAVFLLGGLTLLKIEVRPLEMVRFSPALLGAGFMKNIGNALYPKVYKPQSNKVPDGFE